MKRIICMLLLLLFALPVLAEENPFAPFTIAVPEGVTLEQGESSTTFVYGTSRVVVIRIDRVPDADPKSAVLRMLGQFDKAAVVEQEIAAAEGFTAVQAISADAFGPGIDKLTIMVLSHEGDLLILSGYDMAGDEEQLRSLLNALLIHTQFDGNPIVITEEE